MRMSRRGPTNKVQACGFPRMSIWHEKESWFEMTFGTGSTGYDPRITSRDGRPESLVVGLQKTRHNPAGPKCQEISETRPASLPVPEKKKKR